MASASATGAPERPPTERMATPARVRDERPPYRPHRMPASSSLWSASAADAPRPGPGRAARASASGPSLGPVPGGRAALAEALEGERTQVRNRVDRDQRPSRALSRCRPNWMRPGRTCGCSVRRAAAVQRSTEGVEQVFEVFPRRALALGETANLVVLDADLPQWTTAALAFQEEVASAYPSVKGRCAEVARPATVAIPTEGVVVVAPAACVPGVAASIAAARRVGGATLVLLAIPTSHVTGLAALLTEALEALGRVIRLARMHACSGRQQSSWHGFLHSQVARLFTIGPQPSPSYGLQHRTLPGAVQHSSLGSQQTYLQPTPTA